MDVQITDFDTNKIKADQTLATSSSTTFMAMGAGALKTVFDVAVLAIIPDVARTVTSYTADNVPPVLNNFAIALNSGSIPFPFSETVDVLTLDPREFRLGNAASTSSTVALTGGVASPNKTAISFTLALVESDLSAIKSNTALDYFENNSFALISSCFIRDPNNVVAVTAIADGATAGTVTSYTADNVPPVLNNFAIALNSGSIPFPFSETVDVLTLDPREFRLGNAASTSSTVALTGGVASPNKTAISFTLALVESDLSAIKSNTALDYFENNSFALISSCFIRDPNNVVAVTAIADGAAREALVVTPDITAPTLVPFSLNMNASTSRIGFSESVKAAALNPNKLIIQQGASAGGVSKQLARGSAVQVDDTTEELTLKNDDLNNLKAGQARYCHLHE